MQIMQSGARSQEAFAATSTVLNIGFSRPLLEEITLVTVVCISTCRFVRFKAGVRYAVEELLRAPPPTVDWANPNTH